MSKKSGKPGKKSGKQKKKQPDPVAAEDLALRPAPTALAPPPLDLGLLSTGRLEHARTNWQYAEWSELAALGLEEIAQDQDRARLALLVAAAHTHLGNTADARRYILQAQAWGVSRSLVARVLIASTHNSLGKVAAAVAEGEDAEQHFNAAIRHVEPQADSALLGRTRRVRELAQAGLLMDASGVLEKELSLMKARPEDHAARLKVISTELQILKLELQLATQRGQLHRDGNGEGMIDPRSRAVSQLGQDLWVLERTGNRRGGYFIEFGAADGILLSNTWLLESEFGWTGICAEPNPKFHADLVRNRRCITSDACVGARTGDNVEFILADEFGSFAELADKDKHHAIRSAYRAEGAVSTFTTVSLGDLLTRHDAPREIDYLSIDTEGSEFQILETFPFDKWQIRLITVEHNYTPMRAQLFDLLTSKGYRRTEADFDDWYELVDV